LEKHDWIRLSKNRQGFSGKKMDGLIQANQRKRLSIHAFEVSINYLIVYIKM
jgi:hypothetical protein